jgi:hypothetical protein
MPSPDRLSTVAAAVVLALTFARFFQPLEASTWATTVPIEVVLGIAAGTVAGAGSDSLVRSRPAGRPRGLLHTIVPAAATLVVAFGLRLLPIGPAWWIGLGASMILILAVLIAEYIVSIPGDPRQPTAVFGLSVLTFILLFILFAAMYAAGLRAVLSSPLGGVLAAGLSLRLLSLQLPTGRGSGWYALGVGVVAAETIWALSYWRTETGLAAAVGLLMVYLMTGLLIRLAAPTLNRRVWLEYSLVAVLGLTLIVALALAV